MKKTVSDAARAVAACGGYSEDRYQSWPAVAEMLLRRGYTPLEAEAIMRSKWTRWAADQSMGIATVKHLEEWLDDPRNDASMNDVHELVRGTETELPKELQF